jgi:hypothetical protein
MNGYEEGLVVAAKRLSDAKVAFARAFQLAKISSNGMPVTDRSAEYIATEQTGDAVTKAQADYEIARLRLERNEK